ncbi:hypothetical protein DWG20_09340 [Crenobacter cavernae]|uniref:Uncharacterized protein n=2 Tax=Crenobacter cavernae TaxID=2290923 RepID=A0A345YAA8_9NEIS|nr:hypothetical protein DWG20_09340 [Crenobacter cavernae]
MLSDLEKRQLPFAMARALTLTAQDVKRAEIAEMQRAFDRPTKYTLNSLYVKPATKRDLRAWVWLKYDAGKGTPADKYLAAEIQGGGRKTKRFERALQQAGVMPRGMFAVPGSAAQKDAYGNMSRGQIVQILSYLRAFGEQGYKANMTDRRRGSLAKGNAKKGVRGFQYFVLRERHGKLPPGIYKKTAYSGADAARVAHLQGGGAKPVVIFVKSPGYSRRFKFFEVAGRTVRERFTANFDQALADALASARG